MIIPKNTFLEMDEDIEVEVLYPNMQVDVFPYVDPSKSGLRGDYDSIGYMVSTTFNGKLFYDYYSAINHHKLDVERLVDAMKENVKLSVLRSI